MTKIKVRGYHCDAYGHVNNARILEFYEEARWDFLETNGRMSFFRENQLLFFIVNIQIDYKLSLEPGHEIELDCSFLEHGSTSITLKQDLYLDKNLAGSARIKFVLFNAQTKRPEKIQEEHIKRFS